MHLAMSFHILTSFHRLRDLHRLAVLSVVLIIPAQAFAQSDVWNAEHFAPVTEDERIAPIQETAFFAAPKATQLNWPEKDDGSWLAPYGAIQADMIYASQRTNPGPFTLFVFSPETQGEDAFSLDMRRTRLGIDLAGPSIRDVRDRRTSRGRFSWEFRD